MSGNNAEDNWVGDYLKRQDQANYLTKYLAARYEAKRFEEGFVLAVNGDWGLGKSFMISRWRKDLQRLGHPAVMFNSWENDFTQEPLVAFIAELNSAMSIYFDELPRGVELRTKWLAQAKAVLMPSLKVAGMALLKHGAGIGFNDFKNLIVDDDQMDESAKDDDDEAKFDTKDLADKLSKAIDDELKSHANVKNAIANFKLRLKTLVTYLDAQSGIQLPIFVFIDELDRCRPDYAIKLLEGIKHLFGIPGIHFIVATNLSELAHSVRAVYGDRFSAERYLKRFFDMEYSLPEPSGLDFATELITPLSTLTNATYVTGFDGTFRPDEFPGKNLPFIFLRYAVSFTLSLRDQQQAAKVLEAALLSMGNEPIHIHFLMFLACLYQKDSQVYHDVAKAKNLSERTGFSKTVLGIGMNESYFPVYDSTTQDGKKNVSIISVAEVYMAIVAGNYHQSQSTYDFPQNLSLSFRNRMETIDAFVKYIEIVRRAGQFAD
jgi:hypothetical protein